MRKFNNVVVIICCVFTLSSCAVSSGMKVGELPQASNEPVAFNAANGIRYNVTELNADNIPTVSVSTSLNHAITLPPLNQSAAADYRIAAGDLLDIHLPSYPDITPVNVNSSNINAIGYLVDQSGYVQFPMIGRVKANGLTVIQFANVLSSKLLKYLKYPDAQVKVLAYRGRKFFIDGEVKTPGQFAIADQPVSILSAIGMAGGNSTTADTENVTLTRSGRVYHFGLKAMERLGYSANQLMIHDGDIIRVGNTTQNKVTVIGEFIKPSPVVIPTDGISLAGVIGEASGINGNSANASKVYVLREDPKQQHADIYHLDLNTITNLSVANRFQMQPGDIVYVDPTGLVRWNRVINMLLPSTSLTDAIRKF